MTEFKKEYEPLMLHGWTHLPAYLWPASLPVDHLPWIFRDVANYFPPRETDLRKSCVFIRPVHNEMYLTIEHLRIHWLTERKKPQRNQFKDFHPLQEIQCEEWGKGPRYVAARNNSEFAIPIESNFFKDWYSTHSYDSRESPRKSVEYCFIYVRTSSQIL